MAYQDGPAPQPDSIAPGPRPGQAGGLPAAADDSGNEVMRSLRMMLERKWLIVFCMFLLLVVAVLQLKKATNIYIATATIQYEPSSMRYMDFGESGRPPNASEEIRTQVEIISGPAITAEVIRSLGLSQPNREGEIAEQSLDSEISPFVQVRDVVARVRRQVRTMMVPAPAPSALDPEEERFNSLIQNLRSKITVRQQGDTRLINIIVRDSNPRQAANIANAFAEQYVRSLGANKSTSYMAAMEFFDSQVAKARADMEAAERRLLDFSEQAGTDLRLMEQESEIALSQTRTLREEIAQLRSEVALFESEAAMSDPAILAYLLAQDRSYVALVDKLTELKLLRVARTSEDTERNPEVIRLDRQIASLEEQIQLTIDQFRLESAGRQTLARERLIAMEARLRAEESTFNSLQRNMIEYRAMRIDVDSQKEIFDQLLSRMKEINVASGILPDNVKIHARATPPGFPSEPRLLNTLISHALVGFFLGSVLAIGMGWLDRSLHNAEQAEKVTGAPVLGTIPFLGSRLRNPFSRRRAAARLISQFDSYSAQWEAFRLLRTGLQYSSAGRGPQIMLVSSCMPAEGKSTVAINMAIAFAGLGEKTLLVDTDLKLPSQHEILEVPRNPGLTDILTGHKTISDVIRPTTVESLDFMPAGPSSPSPVELLDSAAMDELLQSLRGRYTRIILDAAPLQGMSDALVVARKSDGLCLVASLGRTRIDVLRRVMQVLATHRIRLLGIICNSQSARAWARGVYGGYYGYSDAYTSGYGYFDSMRRRGGKRTKHESDEAVTPKT